MRPLMELDAYEKAVPPAFSRRVGILVERWHPVDFVYASVGVIYARRRKCRGRPDDVAELGELLCQPATVGAWAA